MLKTGICSIIFRQLGVEEIVCLVKKAGLDAVEWGGDVHVRPGDRVAAETARKATQDAGLDVSSYGSYYRVLDEKQVFEPSPRRRCDGIEALPFGAVVLRSFLRAARICEGRR